jgi:hypothetical protein
MQVFEHQAKVELLEYGYMLHRRIADRVTDNSLSADRVAPALLAAQRDLADFEWALQDTGRYGEVREQLEAGLTAYGVPKLRERVAGVLRVRQEAALYYGGLAAGRWAAFLGLVAGVLAVPPLADAIVRPAWQLLGLPRPAGPDSFALLVSVVALGLVTVLLVAGYAITRRSAARSW